MRTRGHRRALVGVALSVAMLAFASVAADGVNGQPGNQGNDNGNAGDNGNGNAGNNGNAGDNGNGNAGGNGNARGNGNGNAVGHGDSQNANPGTHGHGGGNGPGSNGSPGTSGNPGHSGNANAGGNGNGHNGSPGNQGHTNAGGNHPNAHANRAAGNGNGLTRGAVEDTPRSGDSEQPGPGASKPTDDNTTEPRAPGDPFAIFDYRFTSRYQISLDASRSFALDGPVVSHTWHITGLDPITSTSLNLEFSGDGGYLVMLEVTDSFGGTDATALAFLIEPPYPHFNQDPVARVALTPDGTHARLDASPSHDPDGDALSYEWSLDGRPIGTERHIDHYFPENGPHEVTLIVRDAYGGRAETREEVDINGAEPPHIHVDLWSGAFLDEPVFLDASGSWAREDGPLSFDWSVEEYPAIHSTQDLLIFQPAEEGDITVHLTVTTRSGLSATHTEELHITDWWAAFSKAGSRDDASFSVSVATDSAPPTQASLTPELVTPPTIGLTLLALTALAFERRRLE